MGGGIIKDFELSVVRIFRIPFPLSFYLEYIFFLGSKKEFQLRIIYCTSVSLTCIVNPPLKHSINSSHNLLNYSQVSERSVLRHILGLRFPYSLAPLHTQVSKLIAVFWLTVI
jgi:hypothetical protein